MNGTSHTPDFAAGGRAIGRGVRAMTGLLTDRLAARPAPDDGRGGVGPGGGDDPPSRRSRSYHR